MKTIKKGILIVFEGIDGTGKSTQLNLLADHLRTEGYNVLTTREPTDGQYGKAIRQLYINRESVTKEQELQLFIADRKEHIREVIQPALDQKQIILCDRYFLSTAAYQGAVGFDPEEILKMNRFAPDPDIALLFLANPEISIERIAARGDTLNDFEHHDQLQKVEKLFLLLNREYIQTIDSTGTIESVHEAVIQSVMPLVNQYGLDS